MATLLIRIEGLTRGDEAAIERALSGLPGVFGVVVSGAEGCAEVDLEDDEIDVDRVIQRVRDAGFDAHLSG